MDIDSVHEETDPLASSGMSVSSFEDGMPGERRRKSKSALTRLRSVESLCVQLYRNDAIVGVA